MSVPVRGGGDAAALASISEVLLARLVQEQSEQEKQGESRAYAEGRKGLWAMNAWLLVEVSEWNPKFAQALVRHLLSTLTAITARQHAAVGAFACMRLFDDE
jgi:hypothetical protein